jgi:hypothetical protein
MTEPTDNMIAEVLIHACAAGHVHLSLVESGNGDSGLHGIFTPQEAFDLGCLLIKASAEADDVLRKAGVGGDVGPCTLH